MPIMFSSEIKINFLVENYFATHKMKNEKKYAKIVEKNFIIHVSLSVCKWNNEIIDMF